MLMPVCMRYCKNEEEAREYLNLGFYKILTQLKKYPEHVPFEAWSKRVLINLIIDELRKKKTYRKHVEVLEDKTVGEEGGYNFEQPEISAEEIYGFIRSLPPKTAAVFNLYALDGYTHKEVAGLLKIGEGTSKWHYSEARKQLKAMIEKARTLRHKKLSYGKAV